MKRVAIVGAGPAGTAAARELQTAGIQVTIFEREAEGGGLLRFGYPVFRMPTAVSVRTTERLQELGVEYRFGSTLGKDISPAELERDYDAVILALGAPQSKHLGIPGEELPGVWPALRFLHEARSQESFPVSGEVIVIGGGDTAVDSATTALFQGADTATIIHHRPEGTLAAQEREVTAALAKGVRFMYNQIAERFEQADRLRAVYATPEGEVTHDADLIIVAIGQFRPTDWLRDLGIIVHDDGTTSHPTMFVAGDSHYGANMLADAIKDGRAIAERVKALLKP